MNKTHRSILLHDIKKAFPELRKDLNEEHGLLHCEMHRFCDFVQSLIANDEKDKLIKAFQIIEYHFMNGNEALVNAIAVSFLEHLDLGLTKDTPSWANQYLPQSLRQFYKESRKYHEN